MTRPPLSAYVSVVRWPPMGLVAVTCPPLLVESPLVVDAIGVTAMTLADAGLITVIGLITAMARSALSA